ncbi:MAG: 7-carboxy-7-deazaguanine synthase QueE [Bacteroidota bacterium]
MSDIQNSIPELVKEGKMLPLMESFYTLQGEGFHTGTAAFFIRIGGCDVGCWWCDTRESWNPDLHPATSISDILALALKHKSRAIVITGGEPLNYNMAPLTDLLHKHGFRIFLETSGSEELSGEWDWICLSPKTKAPPLPGIYSRANELKVIVFEENDFFWAEEMSSHILPSCQLFLQPEWSRRDVMMPKIIDFILANPHWRISLQSHKYMHIP